MQARQRSLFTKLSAVVFVLSDTRERQCVCVCVCVCVMFNVCIKSCCVFKRTDAPSTF